MFMDSGDILKAESVRLAEKIGCQERNKKYFQCFGLTKDLILLDEVVLMWE